MPTQRKSFIIHKDSLSVLDELSDEQAGLLFKAIKAYQNDEGIELDSLTKIVFSPFKAQFDRDDEKYKKIVERNKNNGSKGGRPKTEANPENPDKPSGLNGNPENPSKADSVSKSKSDSKNDSVSESKSKKTTLSAKANNDCLEVFNYWKEVMKKSNSSILNAKRTKAITGRLKEGYTVEQIKMAIVGCSMTPHNMGQNNNGKKYDDLELICRDGVQVERFANNAQQQAPERYGQHVSKTLDALNNMEWDDD